VADATLDEIVAVHEAAHAVVQYRAVGFVGGPITMGGCPGVLGSCSDYWSDSENPDHVEGDSYTGMKGETPETAKELRTRIVAPVLDPTTLAMPNGSSKGLHRQV
jgi:hypothetical protein